MAKSINSIKDIKVGDIIKSTQNWHLSGEVVQIDENYVRYKSIRTGLIQSIHVDNISHYEIIN